MQSRTAISDRLERCSGMASGDGFLTAERSSPVVLGRVESTTGNGVQAGPVPALSADGIVKRWRGLECPVLDGVDVELAPGRAVHIAGRNGIGKTTLLRILAGLIAADEGRVRAHGLDPRLDRREYQRCVALLSAGDRGLYARLSVRLHLDLWARISFVPKEQRSRLIEESIERFSLAELMGRRVDRLSMGQRQRLRLAGLLLDSPKVVLLDEPRNSLDDEGLQMLIAALGELLADGSSLLWCSPSGETADLSFESTYVLESGMLVRR